ncbi:MAG: hypothetical protein Q9227_004585 [Pyrenula ochraceoflavens]
MASPARDPQGTKSAATREGFKGDLKAMFNTLTAHATPAASQKAGNTAKKQTDTKNAKKPASEQSFSQESQDQSSRYEAATGTRKGSVKVQHDQRESVWDDPKFVRRWWRKQELDTRSPELIEFDKASAAAAGITTSCGPENETACERAVRQQKEMLRVRRSEIEKAAKGRKEFCVKEREAARLRESEKSNKTRFEEDEKTRKIIHGPNENACSDTQRKAQESEVPDREEAN